MSRSYKKTPNTSIKSKWHKRQAAKKTRRSKDTLQNKQYRKQYNSWDIYDYRETGTTFNEFYRNLTKYASILGIAVPTKREARNKYRKIYLSK